MLTAVIAVALFGLVMALVVAVARDPGLPPEDVALAYEQAWNGLDFDALWTLSGDELRDGMSRTEYSAAKRTAYATRPDLHDLALAVQVEQVETGHDLSTIRTHLTLRGGSDTRNELQLVRRSERWLVVGYHLLGSPESRPD